VFGEVSAFGGVVSNVPDLARYVALQFRVLEPPPPFTAASLLEWRTPRHIINPQTWRTGMALGWWVRRDETFGNLVTHGGEVDGHSANVVLSPELGVGLIVLSIVGADTAEAISREIMPHAFGPALAQDKQLTGYHEAEDWMKLRDMALAIVARHPASGRANYELGYASLMLGEIERGATASLAAAKLSYQTTLAYYNAACGFARAGDKDSAFKHLQLAVAAGFRDREQAQTDPDLAKLHDDPRWAALLRGE
jgi:hypothetical protein